MEKEYSKADENRLSAVQDGKWNPTDDQKRAVLAKGRVLVSAAAGSGKTSTMVKRIMLMIAEGASMKNMLVLVYNTAAADELKERLHRELFDRACAERGELQERYRKELDDLPFCKICTIHAFCNALIRDNFDKLELSPTFTVLDEQAHAAYMNAALDSVFEEYSQEGDALFGDIAEIFSQARKDDNLKANVIKLYSLLDVQPHRQAFLDTVKNCYDSFENSEFMSVLANYYKAFFGEAADKINELPLSELERSLVKYGEAARVSLALCNELVAARTFMQMCGVAAEYQKPALGRRVNLDERIKALSDVAKSYIDEVFDAAKELAQICLCKGELEAYHAQNALYIKKLIEITLRFDNELQKAKRKDDVLSFEDLQHLASKLLLKHPDIGSEYEAVFVDEYQDINPTQEFIVRRLVKGECFMVGDVKQSIYGFRLADPAIFLSRQRSYIDGDGTAIDFNRNFRSARQILSFVNGVFNAVMTQKSADVDYKNEAAFELDGVSSDGAVQLHLFTESKPEGKEVAGLYDIAAHEQDDEYASASQNEGRFIAREIKTLVGIAKKKDGSTVGYGDIAILFRSRSKGSQQIIEQLKSDGIPVDESVFSKSSSRPERELINFLRVLDNPRQDIPLAGFLLSFFGGYCEEELAAVAAEEGECFYDKAKLFATAYGCGDDDNEQGDKCLLAKKLRDTFAMLDGYRTKASFKNVAELMGGIVSDFCYDAYLNRLGEAAVYGIKAFIASVASQAECSLGKFLEDYCEAGEISKASGGGDRVHISTFHGFKGLEIPVVFVADAGYGFNYESGGGDLSAIGKGYIGLKYFDFESKRKAATLSKIAVSKLNRQQRVKEEMRLFYVALTRAEKLMYVTASVSAKKAEEFGCVQKLSGAGCDLDFISAAVCAGTLQTVAVKHGAEDMRAALSAQDNRMLPKDDGIVKAIKDGRSIEYKYAESTSLAMKYSVSSLDGQDEQAVRVFEDGASAGTAYHKVMQNIDFFARGEDAVEAELKRMTDESVLTEEERELIDISLISACLDSEIAALARAAQAEGKCLREQPFMMYKPANEVGDEFTATDKVLVQGVIDLFIGGEKNVLVDFKYSRLDDETLAKKYKKQLYLYKTAIEGAIDAKIDRILLYSFINKSVVECV